MPEYVKKYFYNSKIKQGLSEFNAGLGKETYEKLQILLFVSVFNKNKLI